MVELWPESIVAGELAIVGAVRGTSS
jgi:hypothetical protein